MANITYSLCAENAFEHMNACIFDMRSFDGVLLCTDGVLAPYRTIANFKEFFVAPVVGCVINDKIDEVKNFICELGTKSGIGDDVSLSMMLKRNVRAKFYT